MALNPIEILQLEKFNSHFFGPQRGLSPESAEAHSKAAAMPGRVTRSKWWVPLGITCAFMSSETRASSSERFYAIPDHSASSQTRANVTRARGV